MSDVRTTQALERIGTAVTAIANRSYRSVLRVEGPISWWWGGALFTLGFVPGHFSFWQSVFTMIAWPMVLGQHIAGLIAK